MKYIREDPIFFRNAFLVLFVPFLLAQLIPYGHQHTNPPVTGEPEWASPEVRTLVVRACYDCHSNLTHWPWYSYIAPASWLAHIHVYDGREELNFTEWDLPGQNTKGIADYVYINHMPPTSYQFFHASARFTEEERQVVVDGFKQMFPPN